MKPTNLIKTFLAAGLLTASASCSDFLEEYSQDKARVETWEDLDELLLGDGHLETFLDTRMNLAVSVTEGGNALIDLIREERAREFLLEGHRWFDLRRYTVCQPYSWSKTIEHAHNYYEEMYDSNATYADWYRLEENDVAYTLPVPRAIREFQVSMAPSRDRRAEHSELKTTNKRNTTYETKHTTLGRHFPVGGCNPLHCLRGRRRADPQRQRTQFVPSRRKRPQPRGRTAPLLL